MRKIIYLLTLTLSILSCKQTTKDYVIISGKVKNMNSDSLIIMQHNYRKKIHLDAQGNFSDTLKVKPDLYYLYYSNNYSFMYLKNGFDINMTVDAAKFHKTITHTGTGSGPNNYLTKRVLYIKKIHDDNFIEMDKTTFDKKINTFFSKLNTMLENTEGADSLFVSKENNFLNIIKYGTIKDHKVRQEIRELEGKVSPKFIDYENYNGGSMSLDDLLKGKYIFMDFWATWCGACLKEMPPLEEIQKKYQDENIAFVSISLDNKDFYSKWRDLVKEKDLKGIQLNAKEDTLFANNYLINTIPRFVLLNPDGKIINSYMPFPSDPKLEKVLDSILNI